MLYLAFESTVGIEWYHVLGEGDLTTAYEGQESKRAELRKKHA